MYDPETQSLLGVVDQPLAEIVRSYATSGGLGQGGDKGEVWLTLTLPSTRDATDDVLSGGEEEKEGRGAEEGKEDQDKGDDKAKGREAEDGNDEKDEKDERAASASASSKLTATAMATATATVTETAATTTATATPTVASRGPATKVAVPSTAERRRHVRVRVRLNTHLELLDPEFAFCGFHGAIAATTALSNGSGLSMCPLRTNGLNGPNGPNGSEHGPNGASKLVRRLAKACAVWMRPSLAQWAELDLIEDAERRAVPGELGEGSFPLDGTGTGADTDDETSMDGTGIASPWLRRRRRREKGRWKRMFVPNMVQKKLDFVAQTKKKMAKMQVTVEMTSHGYKCRTACFFRFRFSISIWAEMSRLLILSRSFVCCVPHGAPC